MLTADPVYATVAPRYELAQDLRDRWREARRGNPSVVVLSGEQGIGKTHVLESLLDEVRADGEDLVVGRFREFSSAAPFRRTLGNLRAMDRLGDGHDESADRDPLATAVELVTAARKRPLLMGFEDIHWADEVSLAVLHHLVDEVAFDDGRLAILVVMTARPSLVDPCQRLVTSVDATARGRVHTVARLTAPELNTLVVDNLGKRPSVHLLEMLESLSDGVPLDAKAILDHLHAQGQLGVSGDRVESSIEAHEIDSTPASLLHSRVAELTATEREHVAALACLGDGATTEQVAAVVATMPGKALRALRSAEAGGVLISMQRRWSFVHSALQRAAYLAIPRLTRMAIHARMVELRMVDDEIGLADHAIRAGAEIGEDVAFRLLSAGGWKARDSGAWTLGGQYLEAALRTGPGHDLDDESRTDLEMAIAEAAYRALDFPRAEHFVELVRDRVARTGDRARAARIAELGVRYRVSRESVKADDPQLRVELEQVLATDGVPPRELALAHGLLAEIQAATGAAVEGVQSAAQARDLAAQSGDLWATGRAEFASGAAALGALSLHSAADYFRSAARTAERSEDVLLALWSRVRLALVALGAGDIDRAQRESQRALAHAMAIRNWAEGSFAAALNSAALAAAGQPESAARRAVEATALYDRAKYMATPRFGLETMARTLALSGDHLGARRALERWEHRGQRIAPELVALVDRLAERPVEDTAKIRWRPGVDMISLARCAIACELSTHLTEAVATDQEMLDYVEAVLAVGICIAPSSGISFLRLRASLIERLGRCDEAEAEFVRAAGQHREQGAHLEAALCQFESLRLKVESGRAGPTDFDEAKAAAARVGLGSVLARIRRLYQAPSSSLRRPASGTRGQSSYRVVMFTDVVGSTSIGVEHGDRDYLTLIRQHDSIVRNVLDAHSGFLFDTAGDGMLAWFLEPDHAVRAGLEILDQVRVASPVNPNLRLWVRIGIADGTPIELEGDLFGTTVNLAARVVDQAEPGQVLCTESVRQGLSDGLARNSRPMGTFALKGFPESVLLIDVGDRSQPAWS